MPRAKNDPYKRKSAQALNHLAAAILDMNDIYLPFKDQMEMLLEQAETLLSDAEELNGTSHNSLEIEQAITSATQAAKNSQRYEQYLKDLTSIMMGIAAIREHIILFIGEVWNLDEESVKVYMA